MYNLTTEDSKWTVPVGSTSLASFIASEVAISWLAGDIANMTELGYKIRNEHQLELKQYQK